MSKEFDRASLNTPVQRTGQHRRCLEPCQIWMCALSPRSRPVGEHILPNTHRGPESSIETRPECGLTRRVIRADPVPRFSLDFEAFAPSLIQACELVVFTDLSL